MIGSLLDRVVGVFSPVRAVQRQQARRMLSRSYAGAESNRLTANKKPRNQSADQEAAGPWGADALRAWSRMLVRDNAYAWGVVDTIVSSVVGNGILTQSNLPDNEELNERRDDLFNDWSRNCDVNGVLDFHSMQSLIQREIVEAGEVLVHMVTMPEGDRGIRRPVPLALELIEADRLAADFDTMRRMENGNRIVRGVELDELGKPVAYHVYPNHPTDIGVTRQEPIRLLASNVLHLFRRERVGQTRGISWFAPVVSWLRDLGTYLENEMVASAISSCFTAAIKTKTPVSMLGASGDDTQDEAGNTYDYIQPGQIMHLQPDEDISFGSPGRPNSGAEPWISLMLRGVAVGTGLSYETVARDYSKTTYSANRASQLEDRRRFRCWQLYLKHQLCEPVWYRFCEAAAMSGQRDFPTAAELLNNPMKAAPVEFQATGWEWVDPVKEQKASEAAIAANQSTLAYELGAKGRNWRKVLMQRAKEREFMQELGMQSEEPAEQEPQEIVEEIDEPEQAVVTNG
jgi:lambda family phage portal protein